MTRAMAAGSSLHRPTQRDPWSRLLAAAGRVARHGEGGTATTCPTPSAGFDHAAKRLELLLTRPVCETEKVIHSLAYEPGFEPFVPSVHALHPRERAGVTYSTAQRRRHGRVDGPCRHREARRGLRMADRSSRDSYRQDRSRGYELLIANDEREVAHGDTSSGPEARRFCAAATRSRASALRAAADMATGGGHGPELSGHGRLINTCTR